MSEEKDKKNEVKQVNVIKRPAQPKAAEKEAKGSVEKKVIVLKKKPVVVKVKEKEEEKHVEPLDTRPGHEELASKDIKAPVITRPANLPPLNPEKKPAERKEAPKEKLNVLTGKSYMTNTAVNHQNTRIQSTLHNGPVIIKSQNLPPIPGQKGAEEAAPSRPRVAGIVGGRPAGGSRAQGNMARGRFQGQRPHQGPQCHLSAA